MRQLISSATITQLYMYLRNDGSSYNDLRLLFENNGISPQPDVPHRTTRKKDSFLDEYIVPLQLDHRLYAEKLVAFIEQLLGIHHGAPKQNEDAERLLASLRRDGWNLLGNRIVFATSGVDDLIEAMLQGHPTDTIQREWDRALQSLENDPADAVTAANAMIEATYKYILHRLGQPLPSNQDVQHLAGVVHPLLSIAPEQQAEQDFRRCLGGLLNVVAGLGALRTKIGDAHGAAPDRGDPWARHARLSINAAGTLCLFLVETYIESKHRLPETDFDIPF